MAESLLLPVVHGVLRKATDTLVRKVTDMWGLDAHREKLDLWLKAVHSMLADAEVKSETNPAVVAWMKKLKAAAYQADNVLDDFQYEALRLEAESLGSTTGKVLNYFTSRNPLVFRHKASRDLKKVLGKMDELVTEMNKFGLVARVAEAPQADLYRQTHAALDDFVEIFGRDDDREVVVELLLSQQDQQKVQVLPIIGMGGLGKTTLAKMVYNDCRVQKHFELTMWHCVSDDFKATSIVRSVIELAINGTCDIRDNIELLRRKLQEVIGRKRFLLILDDVWNEDERHWEADLKPLLCSSIGGSGSVIVVTSRIPRVASIMGTLPPYELACLNEEDSWELFSKKAFSKGVEEQAEFAAIGRRIVNKCKGLPLALKTMGGLLSSKHQVQDWETIIAESNFGDEVVSILKLSYRHLSSEMKQCFAFCAVFPKDYGMDKDKLIQLWMANGFIQEEGTMNLTQKGEFIFKELTWRSFIQDVKVEQPLSVLWLAMCNDYNPIACKMHDLMHDLAKDVTDECAFEEELSQKKVSIKDVYHIQLSWANRNKICGKLKGALPLRTLLTPSEPRALKKLQLMSLRAFSGHDAIYAHLKNATYLRYLDLSGSSFVRLPDSVCMLYSLQSLRLNKCERLQFLPEGMIAMRKLSHLYLLDCHSLEQMPPKVSLLQNLCILTTYVVHTRDGCGIEELKDLRQLGNRLELFNLSKVKSGSKVNLHEKQNLSELLLYWGRHKDYCPSHDNVSDNDEEVLESLIPHSELKMLEVHGYNGGEISQWMRDPQMFRFLRELRISNCPRCKDLPVVWLAPSLEHLALDNIDMVTLSKNIDVEAAGNISSLQIFPKLKSLKLVQMSELERWAENSAGEANMSLMFPQLETLTVENCPKLATLPKSPVLTHLYCRSDYVSVPMSLPLGSWPSLIHLEIGLLADLVMPLEDHQSQSQRPLDTLRRISIDMDDSFVSVFSLSTLQPRLQRSLAFVEELCISRCSNSVRWPVEEFRCLRRLRTLSIISCNNLWGSSSEEILLLPQLESFSITNCDSLLEIPMLPLSLKKLRIKYNPRLVALPSNLGNLAKLKFFSVMYCDELKSLPDGMDGLTSLEQLVLHGCPSLEKFPQGLLQRLPTLELLGISSACADLQKRFSKGGEYFDLVSFIPVRQLPTATEPKMEKFLKRFLPFCGGKS